MLKPRARCMAAGLSARRRLPGSVPATSASVMLAAIPASPAASKPVNAKTEPVKGQKAKQPTHDSHDSRGHFKFPERDSAAVTADEAEEKKKEKVASPTNAKMTSPIALDFDQLLSDVAEAELPDQTEATHVAGVVSHDQDIGSSSFDAAYDSAMKIVARCSVEQLCDAYLTQEPGTAGIAAAKTKSTQPPAKSAKRARPPKAPKSPTTQATAASAATTEAIARLQMRSGTWIECSDCGKWRHAADIAEPCQVPDLWYCLYSTDPAQDSCDKPELPEVHQSSEHGCQGNGASGQQVDNEDIAMYNKYTEGSLVLARVPGFRYWPCIVENDPDYGVFVELEPDSNDVATYHVTFLGRPVSRAWVDDCRVRPFDAAAAAAEAAAGLPSAVMQEAAEASALSLPERLSRWGFAARSSGQRQQAQRRRQKKKPMVVDSDEADEVQKVAAKKEEDCNDSIEA